MDIDVVGRLRNTRLPISKPLLPLFEAVVNSIHAIEDSGRQDGRINITVQRDDQKALFHQGDTEPHEPITGFVIEDNGIGFTDQNYREFTRADTTWKASRGGRGVGRFIWLKAFSRVRIDSIFREGQQVFRRQFYFMRSPEGINDLKVESADGQMLQTKVELLGFEEPYASQCPRQSKSIATRIVEYAIDYFVLGEIPKLVIFDEAADGPINLAEVYAELVLNSSVEEYQVGPHSFRIRHFLLHAHPGLEHRLIFCAERRPVREDKLQRQILNLTGRLSVQDSEEELVYVGYISSKFLDDHVDPERTSFLTADKDILFPGELSWSDIEKPALETAAKFLEPFTGPVREAKHKYIQNFVKTEAPEFRYLLKHHPAAIDNIPPNLPTPKLGVELYRLQKDYETQLRQEAAEVLQQESCEKCDLGSEELETHRARYERFLEEWNDLSKAELARYIVHRRATLSLLRARLKRRGDDRYPLETAIHSAIFPLRTTSDDITFDKQNLWVLDEKLSYHKYLASDLRLDQVETLHGVGSSERPDLLIFDNPMAIVDKEPPYTSIVVFEFKRPQRNDYTSDKNPIEQTLRYVSRIRTGDVLDKNGRPIPVSPNTPFFCYIICDTTKTLREQAELANLQETPDGEGYFGYNTKKQAYIEIISFDKLIRDAELRNRILFDKLGINDCQRNNI